MFFHALTNRVRLRKWKKCKQLSGRKFCFWPFPKSTKEQVKKHRYSVMQTVPSPLPGSRSRNLVFSVSHNAHITQRRDQATFFCFAYRGKNLCWRAFKMILDCDSKLRWPLTNIAQKLCNTDMKNHLFEHHDQSVGALCGWARASFRVEPQASAPHVSLWLAKRGKHASGHRVST